MKKRYSPSLDNMSFTSPLGQKLLAIKEIHKTAPQKKGRVREKLVSFTQNGTVKIIYLLIYRITSPTTC
jgi:hypothetical protein